MSGFLLIKLNFIRFNVITSNNKEKRHKICGDIPIEQIYVVYNKQNAGIFINL